MHAKIPGFLMVHLFTVSLGAVLVAHLTREVISGSAYGKAIYEELVIERHCCVHASFLPHIHQD